MFRLTRKMTFALEAVVDVAYNGRNGPVQSMDITRRQDIPRRYLEQVMQQLVRKGILKGVRGPKGGYTLARERRRITLGEIMMAIHEMDNSKTRRETRSHSPMSQKIISPLIDDLNEDIITRLNKITLQDLYEKARQEGIEIESSADFTFTI